MKRSLGISLVGVALLGGVTAAFLLTRPARNGVGRPRGGASMPRPETQPAIPDGSASLTHDLSAPSGGLAVMPVSTNVSTTIAENLDSDSWTRFRGLNGKGISHDRTIPIEWNDNLNLQWKLKLPGAGASSPILTDKFVFLTSYSGYGDENRAQGKMDALERQLNCVDRSNGKLIWTKSTKAILPEDPYQGMGIPEHGYATNSPTTDGQTVYAFFGKSGVFAYDLQGNELWKTSVGTESGNRGWGTAASLVLYKNLVIVNASEESQAIVALDKQTGKTVWSAPASTLELAYGTPVIVPVNDERDDLVIAVPGEVWGLNPSTGKLVWFAETSLTGNLSPSVIQDGEMLYVFGGYRSSGSLAIRTGGKGDITKTHIAWTSRNSSYVVTPVLQDGHLYWIDDQGMYFCVQAQSGELVQKKRVPGMESKGRPVYASPIAIDGKFYMQTRNSGVYVLAGQPEFKVLNQNRFASDDSVFNATPAVGQGQLFLRSNTNLYCVGQQASQ